MAHDAAARSARARFQSGLLAWLRQPDDPAGLREMIAVVRELATDASGTGAVLWRSAESFLATLLDGTLSADDDSRQLCRRIERHLAAVARGETVVDEELRQALFAYVSGKLSAPPATADAPDTVALLSGLHRAMGASMARTAEILPLIAGAVRPRHNETDVADWLAAVRHVDATWQAFARKQGTDCRSAATALVAVALKLNAGPCLRLAEALATALADAEEPAAREHPTLRAAIAAALEIAGDRDGPNHPHFERRVGNIVGRLAKASDETHQMLRAQGRASASHLQPAPGLDVEKFPTLS